MDHTPQKAFVAASNIATAFAAALRHRFEKFAQFVSNDLILLRAKDKMTLKQRFNHFQINMTPHVRLSSQSEKNYLIVQRKEGQQLKVSVSRFESAPAMERILQRTEIQRIRARTEANSDALQLTPRQAADIKRPTPTSFTPLEMVTRQPLRGTSVPPAERNIEQLQPRIDYRPTDQAPRTTPSTIPINIKELTDQVVQVLDRRVIAGHERLTRR